MDEKQYMKIVDKVMSDKTPLPVTIDIMQAWVMISGLQLAHRHPGISQIMANMLEHTARQFQRAIVEVHPEANELIEMGWVSDYDERPTKFRKQTGKK